MKKRNHRGTKTKKNSHKGSAMIALINVETSSPSKQIGNARTDPSNRPGHRTSWKRMKNGGRDVPFAENSFSDCVPFLLCLGADYIGKSINNLYSRDGALCTRALDTRAWIMAFFRDPWIYERKQKGYVLAVSPNRAHDKSLRNSTVYFDKP